MLEELVDVMDEGEGGARHTPDRSCPQGAYCLVLGITTIIMAASIDEHFSYMKHCISTT